jgi:glycosyltransferase involved in cell wall biosynthesis
LQYLLGFKRLGWRVLFLDRLEPDMCVDDSGRPCPLERSINLRYFTEIMKRFELEDSFTLIYNSGERFIGLSRRQILERTNQSAFILNVMGFLDDEEILGSAPKRVFLDIDPGFGQMWCDLGLADLFRRHDAFVTIGENIGRADCEIPMCGLDWITTPQPIVLDYWQPQTQGQGNLFTSIASWRGPFGPIEYNGKTYGLRVHEFRKFVELPRLTNRPFEVAMDIHSAEVGDIKLLAKNKWSLANPKEVARYLGAYRDYIQNSKAEFMVAKNMYVATNSGWFSDRSICYLASGKPVLAQDTGFGRHYPTGEGLLAFTNLEEAVEGVKKIDRDYQRHSKAARAIAEEYFDSDKVLSNLLSKLGVS